MDPQVMMKLMGGGDGATPDPQALLEQLSRENPALAAMMQMMAAQKASAQAREPVVVEGSVVDVATEQIAELSAQLETARAETSLLRERCDAVAVALGACALCWGQDSGCRACRGQGVPGRCIPDEQLFCEYVLPAVRLMHVSRQRSKNVTSLAPVTNGAPRADGTSVRLTS